MHVFRSACWVCDKHTTDLIWSDYALCSSCMCLLETEASVLVLLEPDFCEALIASQQQRIETSYAHSISLMKKKNLIVVDCLCTLESKKRNIPSASRALKQEHRRSKLNACCSVSICISNCDKNSSLKRNINSPPSLAALIQRKWNAFKCES